MGLAKPSNPRLRRGHPLANGLKGAWILAEGAGNKTYDASDNNNNGTLTNGPVWVGGPLGTAISFDNVDDKILCGTAPSLNIRTMPLSILAGITPTGLGGGSKGRIFDKNDANASVGYDFQMGASNQLALTSGNTLSSSSALNVVTLNAFQHVAVVAPVAGASGHIFYVNAASAGSTANAFADPGNSAAIQSAIGGRASDTLRQFQGTIHYVYVYNRALSADEVARVAQDPFAMFRTRRVLKHTASGFTTKFRKTLSPIGGRVGARQAA